MKFIRIEESRVAATLEDPDLIYKNPRGYLEYVKDNGNVFEPIRGVKVPKRGSELEYRLVPEEKHQGVERRVAGQWTRYSIGTPTPGDLDED